MAEIKFNPLFIDSGGKLPGLTVYRRYGKTFTREHVIPHNPRTENQQQNRNLFKEAVESWQNLSMENKELWNNKAKKVNRKGYNYYISSYMENDK